MRIILNSDILHTNRPAAAALPLHLDQFCRDAAAAGAVLVVPRTTLLEDQRNQKRLIEEGVAQLDTAIALMQRYGIQVPEINSRELVGGGDLVAALRNTGIQVEVIDPSLADYRGAEERACLRLSPHPPDTKSDEMRDLIIWEVAVRIAKRDGQAILLSRDEVHSHDRGGKEAEDAGLHRARSIDEALDLLGRVSPAGILAREVLATVWNQMRSAGMPLPPTVSLRRVGNLQFVPGPARHVTGSLQFSVATDAGEFEANVEVVQAEPNVIRAEVRQLRLGGAVWGTGTMTITASGELPRVGQTSDQEVEDLRRLIGRQE